MENTENMENVENREEDDELESIRRKFYEENPNLMKLTWEGAEAASVKEESVQYNDITYDDDDFVSVAGDDGPMEKTKKGNLKETFQCNYCDDLIINSRETMRSHVKGRRHRDRVAETMEDHRNGLIFELPEKEITLIKNEERLRKKVPLRLQLKIQGLPDAFVGLEFIEEYLPLSTDEVEPYYECFLCPSQSEANGMAAHIASAKHIENYLHARFPKDLTVLDMSRSELIKLAHQHNQRDRLHLIKIYESDILFHWQPGKSPWSHEQGGDGMAPMNSREMVNKGSKCTDPLWTKLHQNRSEVRARISSIRVPSGEYLGKTESNHQTLKAIQFMDELTSELSAFKLANGNYDQDELDEEFATIRVMNTTLKIKLLRRAGTSTRSDWRRETPTPVTLSSRRPRTPSPRTSDRHRLQSASRYPRSPSPKWSPSRYPRSSGFNFTNILLTDFWYECFSQFLLVWDAICFRLKN